MKGNPASSSPYERLGDALIRKGQILGATANLQRAAILAPNTTGPLILLGKAYLRQGKIEDARFYLERARALDANNYMTHSLLALACRQEGQIAKAQRETALSIKLQTATAPNFEENRPGP